MQVPLLAEWRTRSKDTASRLRFAALALSCLLVLAAALAGFVLMLLGVSQGSAMFLPGFALCVGAATAGKVIGLLTRRATVPRAPAPHDYLA